MKYATIAEAHNEARRIAQSERVLVYIYNSAGGYISSKERLQPLVDGVNNFLIGEVRPRWIGELVDGLHR
jgi:hypothetical protein